MKKIILFLLFTRLIFSQNFPDYNKSIKQTILDLSNQYTLLFVNLKPGSEDIGGILTQRLLKGYKVYNLYFTRGETEEGTNSDLYNEKIAAELSAKLDNYFSKVSVQNYYLNFKINRFFKEKDQIIDSWGGKELILKDLRKIINIIKPDAIFISDVYGKNAPVYAPYNSVIKDLFFQSSSVYDIKNDSLNNKNWFYKKVYHRTISDKQFDINLFDRSIIQNNSFKYLIDEYRALLSNIRNNYNDNNYSSSKYVIKFNSTKVKNSKNIIAGINLKFKKSDDLFKIINNLVSRSNENSEILLDLVTKADAVVDYYKYFFKDLGALGDRIVSNIKYDLSVLKYKLLDLNIVKNISDSAVCKRQLVKFSIDTIKNIPKGKTKIIFYSIDENEWVLMRGNETGTKSFDLFNSKDPFLIVPSDNIHLNTPKYKYQYDFFTNIPFFEYAISHKSDNPKLSFQYFGREFLNIVEKADFEIIPSYKYIKDKTEVSFELTHYLNDPYKNILPQILQEYSSLGTFKATKFSVYKKYDKIHGRIEFDLNDSLKNGDYYVAFTVGSPIISGVTFKKFDLSYNNDIKIGLFTHTGDIIKNYLESLNYNHEINPSVSNLNEFRSIIIDENYFSNKNDSLLLHLNSFVENGGNLVVLKQDNLDYIDFLNYKIDNSITDYALLDDILEIKNNEVIFNYPNKITKEDFTDWELEYSRCLPINYDKRFEELLNFKIKNYFRCGLFRFNQNKGSFYYVSLSLKRQLLTVKQGAYKLLTNLIMYKNEKDNN